MIEKKDGQEADSVGLHKGIQDFETAFPRVTGYISECAKHNPDALYTATEVAELMEYLFELRRRKKDPGGGNREEVQ